MQDDYNKIRKNKETKEAKMLYETTANILVSCRNEKGLKYKSFCYENEIPVSTYNDIIKAKGNASFYKIAQIIRGLGLNFTEFGALLDKELPSEFWEEE